MTAFHRSVAVTLVVIPWLLASTAYARSQQPTVFVGPQVRDGFADIDAGIRDSIRDIRRAAQSKGFRITPTQEEASLVLLVLGRGIVTNGSLGFGSSSVVGGTGSGFGFVVPNTTPTLATVLRVGEYERPMHSEGGTWRAAANTVVDDLTAWWEVNSRAVESTRSR